MKISNDAQRLFDEMNLSRDAVQIIAKGLAQRIIGAAEDPPLEGIVYDVWGLYNEGIPRCRFSVAEENDRVVFEGAFNPSETEQPVRRKIACTREDLLDVLNDVDPA